MPSNRLFFNYIHNRKLKVFPGAAEGIFYYNVVTDHPARWKIGGKDAIMKRREMESRCLEPAKAGLLILNWGGWIRGYITLSYFLFDGTGERSP